MKSKTETKAVATVSPQAVANLDDAVAKIMEQVITTGDLSKLSAAERITFYNQTCATLGLNPLTRPFEYVNFQGKMVMYARKDCAEQLRKIHRISVEIEDQSYDAEANLFTVKVRATDPNGRVDEDVGVITLAPKAASDFRANVIKKTVTQAKRRVTLSICGLGFMDEGDYEDAEAAETAKNKRKGAIRTVTPASGEMPQDDQGGGDQVAAAAVPNKPHEGPQTRGAAPAAFSAGDEQAGLPLEQPEPKQTVGHQPAEIPPRKAAEKITDRTVDDWDEILGQISATGDLVRLEETWKTIPIDMQKILKAAMDRRHKPNCYEAMDKGK